MGGLSPARPPALMIASTLKTGRTGAVEEVCGTRLGLGLTGLGVF